MNKAWHDSHGMPRNATLDQRIAWHLEHARQCGCREIPASVKQALEQRGIAVPERHKD